MSTVYKGITYRSAFVAFWKSDVNTLSFFVPSALGETYFSHSIGEWDSIRASYVTRSDNDFSLYDDLINAGWHYLGQRMEFINKREIVLSNVEPGVYYPRIWRGYEAPNNPVVSYNALNPRKQYGSRYMQSAVAAASLFDYLVDIFRHVEPSSSNYLTYGHKMRELLLLTCTEIESEWRAVLEENTRKESRSERYTTTDYFCIKEPLRLGEWSVSLQDYGQLGLLAPFENWSSTSPTKSLAWYDAYNAVKHHREAEFSRATLENLLNAMAALHIMQVAQWGPEVFDSWRENRFSPFTVVRLPAVSIGDVYMPGIDADRSLSPSLYFERSGQGVCPQRSRDSAD